MWRRQGTILSDVFSPEKTSGIIWSAEETEGWCLRGVAIKERKRKNVVEKFSLFLYLFLIF